MMSVAALAVNVTLINWCLTRNTSDSSKLWSSELRNARKSSRLVVLCHPSSANECVQMSFSICDEMERVTVPAAIRFRRPNGLPDEPDKMGTC
jgi:hypothetical protein